MFGQVTHIVRESTWTFVTSGTGGIGLGFAAANGGEVVLKPADGPNKGFYFGSAGVGLSVGIKRIPKIGKIIDSRGLSERGGGNIAPKSFWNAGIVYIMSGFRGTELSAEDFRGVCCVVDLGAAILVGYSGAAMLINVDTLALIAATSPVLSLLAPPLNPKAMILSRGFTAGPQAGAGVTGQIGYLWPKAGKA